MIEKLFTKLQALLLLTFSTNVLSVKNYTNVDFSTSKSQVERDKATHRVNRAFSVFMYATLCARTN